MQAVLETRFVLVEEDDIRGGASSASAGRRYWPDGSGRVVKNRSRVPAQFLNGAIVTTPSGRKFESYQPRGRIRRFFNVDDIVEEPSFEEFEEPA